MFRSFKLAASLAAVIVFSLAAGSPAVAASATYGPIASGSTDSGTCGPPDWASDTFNRVFKVNTTPIAPMTYSVREDFKSGAFVTFAGSSPGACESGASNGGTVAAGVTGRMHGYFNIVVSNGTYDPNAVCNTVTCGTTADFVRTVFGATATYDVPTFSFKYASACNGTWINASADRGGNHGDITGAPHQCGHGDHGHGDGDHEQDDD